MKCRVTLLALITAGTAEARSDIQCNKAQTRCFAENLQLSIGDQVGIFNTQGQLVAEAEVTALRGSKRALKIERRHGKISNNHSLALLEQDKAFAMGPSLSRDNVYREPSAWSVGGSLGLGNTSIGQSSPILESSAYAGWHWLGDAQLIMRGVHQVSSGEVAGYRDETNNLETLPIHVSGFGLLGGLNHTMFRLRKISVRSEAGVGTMHVTAKVDNSTALAEQSGFRTQVENGFQAYARGSIGGMANFGAWHLNGDFVFSLVNDAFTQALAFGVTKDLE